ncbi:hypothetical protein M3223_13430 [Paenibacillus pasadenensis]|uniref:hypothetical protein n=1 Tax=Paenibacillus pasadenensis TaxID=217090 RepID=UPI002040E464|nr:hypothetical protein [Paenibacillus pasadenensis]MCM3748352.1 hypothetical protein [Paenibacillus pasadenensis]
MKTVSSFLMLSLIMGLLNLNQVFAAEIVDASFNKRYFYDNNNKLKTLTYRLFGQNIKHDYTYDLNGNLTSQSSGWYTDDFEWGEADFSKSRFTAGYPANNGKMTANPSWVISGKYSALGEAPGTLDWSEFLHTDLQKVAFEPNTTYKISFDYRINRASEQNGFYYFLARTLEGETYSQNDKGFTLWKGQAGNSGSKTITLTTGPFQNYYLIWGLHYGGSLSIDNIRISKDLESFESGSYSIAPYGRGYPEFAGNMTSDSAKVINGKYSILGDSPNSLEWSEYLHTDNTRFQFEPNTKYKLTFSYKINRISGSNGYFYFLARTPEGPYSENDRSLTKWNGAIGEKGIKTITFKTGPSKKYYLIWGINNGGSISVDDISITKDEESFESGSYLIPAFSKGYPANAGKITSAPSKVISGKYSVLGESTPDIEWREFLHTDLQKIRFEPNSTYKVTFNYKVIQTLSADGEFYFLARTPEGTHAQNDRQFTSWQGVSGDEGSKTITLTTGASYKYYFIWGVHNDGAISIDDVKISKVS